MSDVYGIANKKIAGEKDPAISFSFWSMVTELCSLSRKNFNDLSSTTIMRFLEKAPPPRVLLSELDKCKEEHSQENHYMLRYVYDILKRE